MQKKQEKVPTWTLLDPDTVGIQSVETTGQETRKGTERLQSRSHQLDFPTIVDVLNSLLPFLGSSVTLAHWQLPTWNIWVLLLHSGLSPARELMLLNQGENEIDNTASFASVDCSEEMNVLFYKANSHGIEDTAHSAS